MLGRPVTLRGACMRVHRCWALWAHASCGRRGITTAAPASLALVFPGQGAQFVGMAKDIAEEFAEARHVLDEMDEALQLRLSSIMCEGDEDTLRRTEIAQPALLAHSAVVLRVLQERAGWRPGPGTCVAVAGHSLGEFSALVAAGALSAIDAVRLVRFRGECMVESHRMTGTQGAMAALLFTTEEQAQQVCKETRRAVGEVVEVANVNSPMQVVVSGTVAAVRAAAEAARASKVARRVVELPVSAAFHCSLMQHAARRLEERLQREARGWGALSVPLISNVTGQPETDAARIAQLLVQQVTAPVRWTACLASAWRAGATRFWELGSGRVQAGLVRNNLPEAEVLSVGCATELRALLRQLQA